MSATGHEAYEAAQRLGEIDSFMSSLEIPDVAVKAAREGDPDKYLILRDGRKIVGNHVIIWLAKQSERTATKYTVLYQVAVVPKRSTNPSNIYHQARSLSIPSEGIAHLGCVDGEGKPVGRVHLNDYSMAQKSLTGSVVELKCE